MRVVLSSILLAMVLALTGCHTTCDARGPSEVCQVHHAYMNTELVTNDKHRFPQTEEYLDARLKFFPNSYPFILPDQCSKCVVYVCEDCARAEKEWKRRHLAGK